MTDREESPPAERPAAGSGEHAESAAAANDSDLADHLDLEVDEAVGPPSHRPPPAAAAASQDDAADDPFAAPPPVPVPAAPEAATEAEQPAGGSKKPHKKAPWWELPLLVAIAVGIAVLVKTFVVQPFYIPSQSMERTLHGCPGCSGDRILVFKPVYDVRDPHPGDIVVFDAPPGWNEGVPPVAPTNPVFRGLRTIGQFIGFVPPDDLVLVKRVIAVGGQTVRGHAGADGRDVVQVSDHGSNGPWRTLQEPFVFQDGPDPRATFGPVTVPKGRLWVMGDHRNDSADSRFHCGSSDTTSGCDPTSSTVPVSDVIGKAVLIAWPPSRWRTLGTPSTFTAGALGASGTLPAVSGSVAVLPVWFLRRRRRRRPRRRSAAGPAR